MPNRRGRLPPFDALVAFEVVLRLGSMSRAAEELHLTQSAVSHRIRKLEHFIGTSLLRRLRPGLSPTPAGSALIDGVDEMLAAARGLRERCRSANQRRRLTIGVGPALSEHWLLRRLPQFHRLHPDIPIELTILDQESHARPDDLDVRIIWVKASEGERTATQRPLFREHVFPVCSPALLRGVRAKRAATRLGQLPLLDKRNRGDEAGPGSEWAWQTWFDRFGVRGAPEPVLRFTSIGPSISAALNGAGVALGRSMLVADALADGRLVRVLPPEADLLSGKLHVARWPTRLADDPRRETFVDWLHRQANP